MVLGSAVQGDNLSIRAQWHSQNSLFTGAIIKLEALSAYRLQRLQITKKLCKAWGIFYHLFSRLEGLSW